MGERDELVTSPLCSKITRDGMTVEVHIYRGADDDRWVLEVVDQEEASTVWDESFPTDQAAFDEVMHTIETEGIGSFLRAPTMKLN